MAMLPAAEKAMATRMLVDLNETAEFWLLPLFPPPPELVVPLFPPVLAWSLLDVHSESPPCTSCFEIRVSKKGQEELMSLVLVMIA